MNTIYVPHVRVPQLPTLRKVLAWIRLGRDVTIADVGNRWHGKPMALADLRDLPDWAQWQIRYAHDRKVVVVSLGKIRALTEDQARKDLQTVKRERRKERTHYSPEHGLDVYRQCVAALCVLDLPEDDRPYGWRDRLPLYRIATAGHRAEIDLGDVDERTIAIKARDAAYRLATVAGKVPACRLFSLEEICDGTMDREPA